MSTGRVEAARKHGPYQLNCLVEREHNNASFDHILLIRIYFLIELIQRWPEPNPNGYGKAVNLLTNGKITSYENHILPRQMTIT